MNLELEMSVPTRIDKLKEISVSELMKKFCETNNVKDSGEKSNIKEHGVSGITLEDAAFVNKSFYKAIKRCCAEDSDKLCDVIINKNNKPAIIEKINGAVLKDKELPEKLKNLVNAIKDKDYDKIADLCGIKLDAKKELAVKTEHWADRQQGRKDGSAEKNPVAGSIKEKIAAQLAHQKKISGASR
jgi:hypothetical protein